MYIFHFFGNAFFSKIWRNELMKFLNCFALTLTIIGAINWGLIGFFNFNLVSFLFGSTSWLSRIIYILVGLCGLYMIKFYGPSLQDE